jgi:hypothetical protein
MDIYSPRAGVNLGFGIGQKVLEFDARDGSRFIVANDFQAMMMIRIIVIAVNIAIHHGDAAIVVVVVVVMMIMVMIVVVASLLGSHNFA